MMDVGYHGMNDLSICPGDFGQAKSRPVATSPLVSVVIPLFNGEQFIEQAVDSVLAQTYRPIELIVVDDGSTDGSIEILRRYQNRLTLLRQTNKGVAWARNAGIAAVTGEFIAFLDQDDWWLPGKVQGQVELLAAHPDAMLIHTGVKFFDDVTQSFVPSFYDRRNANQLVGECYPMLLLGNGICSCSVMVRRSILDRVGPFDTDYIRGNTVQDYDLGLRIARVGALAYLPEELVVYRLHPQQGTWKVCQFLEEQFRVLERALGGPDWSKSTTLRRRVSALLDELGIAYLDAGDRARAQHYLYRAFRTRSSWRRALRFLAAFLPGPGLDCLRYLKSVGRQFAKPQCEPYSPQWAHVPPVKVNDVPLNTQAKEMAGI